MQLYGLDENHSIPASRAKKGKNYRCPECFNYIRLRSGNLRQPHFFHLGRHLVCRQAQKSAIHLRLQSFVHYLFYSQDAEMEKSFSSIGRIADVACIKEKKIFEIQYSPITLEEAKSRCRDYEELGFVVIWILHENSFNKKKVSPAEKFLRSKVCYFTNMDEEGRGLIYDQFEKFQGNRRIMRKLCKQVNLREANTLPVELNLSLLFLKKRAQTWPLYHKGDLIDAAINGDFSLDLLEQTTRKKTFFHRLKNAYLSLLCQLLESNSR